MGNPTLNIDLPAKIPMTPPETVDQKALNAIERDSLPAAAYPISFDALKGAISSLPIHHLRSELEQLCGEVPQVKSILEQRLLVRGKEVKRYHIATDAGDEESSESEREDREPENNESDYPQEVRSRSQIAIADEEYVGRMAVCEHCKAMFDLTLNKTGDCSWHPGTHYTSILSQCSPLTP
jgi:hypothetical protein